MAKILLSLPDEFLKKIDDYRKVRGLKRNQFFMEAASKYFMDLERKEYFDKRREAVDRIKKTSSKITGSIGKDWDPVKELRVNRDKRTARLSQE